MGSASLGCGRRVALELRFAASFRALTGCTRARSVTSLSKHSWQMTVSALGWHHGHALRVTAPTHRALESTRRQVVEQGCGVQ